MRFCPCVLFSLLGGAKRTLGWFASGSSLLISFKSSTVKQIVVSEHYVTWEYTDERIVLIMRECDECAPAHPIRRHFQHAQNRVADTGQSKRLERWHFPL
jgi:hypothetical protein